MLERRVDLKMIGDPGTANFHMAAGWIAANMRLRCAPGSRFTIRTGTGYRDNVEAVGNGEVDLGITTPYDVTLNWARTGSHFFSGTAFPDLRALGYLPQDDRLLLAVREDTGIRSFGDIRERKIPLRIATTCRDGDNAMTWVVELILDLHGVSRADIESWGGAFLEDSNPRKCLALAIEGEADAVFNEAIMVPQWHELVDKVPTRFVSMDRAVLDTLETDYGLKPGILPKGRLKAPEDVACINWSHFGIFVRDDMPEDLAHEITAVLVEERAELEARYRHLPVDRSPLTYPIDPHAMWQGIGAPLHPGAERYYRAHGYMA